MRAEAARSDRKAALAQRGGDLEIERLGAGRVLGPLEARASALAEAAGQGELADDEHRTTDVRDAAVHRLVAGEDAQVGELVGGRAGIGRAVALLDADEHQEAALDRPDDLALDLDARPRHALDDGLHCVGGP